MESEFIFQTVAGQCSFVGDFDGLYLNSPDPWNQSGLEGEDAPYYRLSRTRLRKALNRNGVQGQGLEVGCGHGHVCAFLSNNGVRRVSGIDISPNAILGARQRFPFLDFAVGDICSPAIFSENSRRYDFVILGQIYWYVLPVLWLAMQHALGLLVPNGHLVVVQGFLRPDEQRWAKELSEGWAGADGLLSKAMEGKGKLIERSMADHSNIRLVDGLWIWKRM